MPDGRPAFRLTRCIAPAGSPDLMVTGEDLLHLFLGERMPLDVEDVVIIPLKPGDDRSDIVSDCIYGTT